MNEKKSISDILMCYAMRNYSNVVQIRSYMNIPIGKTEEEYRNDANYLISKIIDDMFNKLDRLEVD